MPDGRVAAIGYKSFTAGQVGRILEIYDPATGAWALGAESKPVRSRASTVMMPDGRILVIGGFVETRRILRLAARTDRPRSSTSGILVETRGAD